jgi:hypothetical protein
MLGPSLGLALRAGNEGDVRQIRRSEFGRPKVGPQGAGHGPAGTKTAAGRFSNE